MNPKHAFTLLELLVVIAVIAILVALLFPPVDRAKDRARRIRCMSNLHQVGLGIRMYSDDSGDAAPGAGIAATSTNHVLLYAGYKEFMKGYVGLKGASSARDKVFACPADIFFPSFIFANNTNFVYLRTSLHDDPVFDYSSYAFNGGDNATRTFGGTNRFSLPGLTGVKLSSVKNPVRTVLVAEASALVPWSWHEPSSRLVFSDAKNMVSFVDGHVSYIKIYWDSTPFPDGGLSFAMSYDPPAGYDYQWSGD
jgi:prepilin-type N-terminal cleavage/methylation domain-containing protein/prepilin-type processing-associated H-X9-DG protein